VAVTGKVNSKEEEEPKIICIRLRPAQDPSDARGGKGRRSPKKQKLIFVPATETHEKKTKKVLPFFGIFRASPVVFILKAPQKVGGAGAKSGG
jgi:hypothetical protein